MVTERTMNLTDYPAGWTCELVVVRLERYLVSALPHKETLAVAEHIEACVACAGRVAMLHLVVTTARRPAKTRTPVRKRSRGRSHG
jgi:anti-sigma factor RsiW